ncbi:MAG: phosphatase PAP2 family protein [Nitrospira sp.]|jgi:membrane-associated phospholipid phosphatase|nr:MAG: phosphatase PAP2 family protein [Nitrospira sp.]
MSVDEILFLAINGLAGQSAAADYFFLQLGHRSTLYLPGACAIAYWIWNNRREALLGGPVLGAAVGLTDFVGGQLKWVFERVRPCRALAEAVKIEPSGCGGLFSFPSNHAANTAAIAAFLQVLYPKSGWITWPIVAFVGFSRVFIGAHYVTDVLGGWMLGGVIGGGAAWALLQWPKFRKKLASVVMPIGKVEVRS